MAIYLFRTYYLPVIMVYDEEIPRGHQGSAVLLPLFDDEWTWDPMLAMVRPLGFNGFHWPTGSGT